MTIILASASPRRQELLRQLGLPFRVLAADIDEDQFPGLAPDELVKRLSLAKAEAVWPAAPKDSLVIAADTVVVQNGRVLGKPNTKAEALTMLQSLAGRSHEVYTGFTVLSSAHRVTDFERTTVRFRALTATELTAYVETGEPMDKAGAYGIQGYGALLVEAIDGDYFTVVGLPVCRLGRTLETFGLSLLRLAAAGEGGESL